ncbi:hypothetical protein GSI_12211 [Ganoderma sinense ZZ0214-1]|uniref:NmrA-like domain-containing protein n=1 Tax=Ganoderma sinense ZZ0214-1 TaxID=1077348 RepID=A0A2G8RY59_9APHY|nr:hypothetical protein GSI_12211 [Ganoderma sinense ZZ0214-1]
MAPKRGAATGTARARRSSKSNGKAAGTSTKSERKILVTAGEGQTGRLVIDLLATNEDYMHKYGELTALVFSEAAKSVLEEYEAVKVAVFDPSDEEALVKCMEAVDTCLLIPPARKDKSQITRTLIEAARKAQTVQNLVLLSSAGCDYAERDTQPHLREFIDLEALVMQPKGEPDTSDAGHSMCIVRAGFYAENLLLYSKQAQGEGRLPIPVGDRHKFAPVALGDIAQLVAFVVTSEGPHGLADIVRSQVLVATGPQLTSGSELAQAASQALGTKMEFESIDNDTAKQILNSDQGAEVDEAEREYLLEYYSLVREGKTNYTATTAMLAYLGTRGQEPAEFFRTYSDEFKPKKRKIAGKPASAGASGKKVPSRGKAATKSAGAEEEASSSSAPPEARRETAPKGL